jgi:endoglucanase
VSTPSNRRRRAAVTAVAVAAAVLGATVLGGPPNASAADDPTGNEQISNGTFDTTTDPWWTAGTTMSLVDGGACAQVPGGTKNPWDVMVGLNAIRLDAGAAYKVAFFAKGTPPRPMRSVVGLAVSPYTVYNEAAPALTEAGDSYSYTFTAPADTADGQVSFQLGGNAEPWTFCMDNVSLVGGTPPEPYLPDTGPRVRVNQVTYLPDGPKRATLVTTATKAKFWQLNNAKGKTVAGGKTVPRGVQQSSGQNVHSIDFSSYRMHGKGFTLVTDGQVSRPFDIDSKAYERLRLDALKFFYTQRSGIAIKKALRPGYERPAGHLGVDPNLGDTKVPCQPKICDYTLDVRGGWYDAGDHGKYVVNGGISVWQLMNQYERATLAKKAQPRKLGDRTLAIPESGNRVPDVLDEARWELEFMLRMQVPAGQPLAGMAHHKIHDSEWTGLPLLPHLDPKVRELHPPSTAATLNLAATAAQGARIFKKYDRTFAARLLAAARKAWTAAVAHPAIYAPATDNIGGGPYDDTDVTDEFYWAAAELFITTGDKNFRRAVEASPHHRSDIFVPGGFGWLFTAAPARMALATVPNRLPSADLKRIRTSVVKGADKYLATIKANAWGLAYAPKENMFDWGSNSTVLNNLVVIATAYDLSGQAKYRNGVVEGMDYLFGRNALNMSYVTGYGEVSAKNEHSRWYAHQLEPTLPHPPRGSLAGGPNSSIQDPLAQAKLKGCVGQFCYIDDIQSWSTNELTVNWNSALAWVASFVADQSAD